MRLRSVLVASQIESDASSDLVGIVKSERSRGEPKYFIQAMPYPNCKVFMHPLGAWAEQLGKVYLSAVL